MNPYLAETDEPDGLLIESRRQEKATLLKEKRARGLHRILQDPCGRAWVNELLERCGIFRQTFTGDAAQTAFNEGVRSVGLMVYAAISVVDEDKILTLLQEYRHDK